jgi:hypothetical protein
VPESEDGPQGPTPTAALVNLRPELVTFDSDEYRTYASVGAGVSLHPAGDTETERLVNLRAIGQRFVEVSNVRLDEIQAVLDAAAVTEALDREPSHG